MQTFSAALRATFVKRLRGLGHLASFANLIEVFCVVVHSGGAEWSSMV